jgi:hypothetical protein
MEFQVPKARLGDWTELDGLALAHFSANVFGDAYPAPGDAVGNAPSTWATVAYSDFQSNLPRISLNGYVYDGVTGTASHPIPNYPVYLKSGTSTLLTLATDVQGHFRVDNIPAPPGADVVIGIEEFPYAKPQLPQVVDTSGIQPRSTGPSIAR